MAKYPCLDPACSGFSHVLIPGHAKPVESQGRLAEYPCLDPACSGFSHVLIPGHAKPVESQGRLAVYFAKDNKAKYGHICSLCFQRCTPEEAKQYALYQHGVDGRAKTSV